MEESKCPNCGKQMQYDIEFEYDHSPYYCLHCGYAEGCGQFSHENCNRCTEYSYCKKWDDIQKGDKDLNIPRCSHCGKKCTEIQEYIDMAFLEGTTPDTFVKQDGTFNKLSNTFICTSCYIKSII